MLRIGSTDTLYNKDNKPYYEIQVFLSSLCDLKWANNYAKSCHVVDKKQKDRNLSKGNEIELFFYFKRKKYLDKFVTKLEKYASYQTVS